MSRVLRSKGIFTMQFSQIAGGEVKAEGLQALLEDPFFEKQKMRKAANNACNPERSLALTSP